MWLFINLKKKYNKQMALNFINNLKEYNFLLDKVFTNVAIKGGFNVDIILNRQPKDVDMYIISSTLNKSKRIINRLCTYIINNNENVEYEINVSIREYSIFNIYFNKMHLQINLLVYPSEIVLLNDLSDMSCCDIVFYDRHIYITKEAIESLNSMTINNDKISSERIKRYLNKGFSFTTPYKLFKSNYKNYETINSENIKYDTIREKLTLKSLNTNNNYKFTYYKDIIKRN